MKRAAAVALILGCLNAAAALVALVLVEVATPDEFGWFAYTPSSDVIPADLVPEPGFPWHYAIVPLVLLLLNLVVVTAYLQRRERR